MSIPVSSACADEGLVCDGFVPGAEGGLGPTCQGCGASVSAAGCAGCEHCDFDDPFAEECVVGPSAYPAVKPRWQRFLADLCGSRPFLLVNTTTGRRWVVLAKRTPRGLTHTPTVEITFGATFYWRLPYHNYKGLVITVSSPFDSWDEVEASSQEGCCMDTLDELFRKGIIEDGDRVLFWSPEDENCPGPDQGLMVMITNPHESFVIGRVIIPIHPGDTDTVLLQRAFAASQAGEPGWTGSRSTMPGDEFGLQPSDGTDDRWYTCLRHGWAVAPD
jgi:hypothetical protein